MDHSEGDFSLVKLAQRPTGPLIALLAAARAVVSTAHGILRRLNVLVMGET